jgi:hypothetical protein
LVLAGLLRKGLFSGFFFPILFPAVNEGYDDFLYGFRDDAIEYFNAIPLSFNNSFMLQQSKVLGYSCLGKFEAFPNFFNVTGLGHQARDNSESHRMSQNFENFGFPIVISEAIKLELIHQFCSTIKDIDLFE